MKFSILFFGVGISLNKASVLCDKSRLKFLNQLNLGPPFGQCLKMRRSVGKSIRSIYLFGQYSVIIKLLLRKRPKKCIAHCWPITIPVLLTWMPRNVLVTHLSRESLTLIVGIPFKMPGSNPHYSLQCSGPNLLEDIVVVDLPWPHMQCSEPNLVEDIVMVDLPWPHHTAGGQVTLGMSTLYSLVVQNRYTLEQI